MHIHLYTRACGCTYALVKAHFVYSYFPISPLHTHHPNTRKNREIYKTKPLSLPPPKHTVMDVIG